jgi:hypothetical protein
MIPICMMCEMRKWPREKQLDTAFFNERKNEFFPEEDYGPYARLCQDCEIELLNYYHEEFHDFLSHKLDKEKLKD